MKTAFSKNIRLLRREHHLTQEQLADAMGVTAGAIYKWEQELSTPDIGIIMELASFFGVSVDSLIGYQMCGSDKERILRELKRIQNEKSCYSHQDLIEGWLRRYPNDFDIVYHCGLLCNLTGTETGDKQILARSIELMTHACALIDQNKDPEISEISIYRDTAIAYMLIGQEQEGLDTLKRHNPCGINNDLIGLELATKPECREKALPYLSKALVQMTSTMLRFTVGYMNIFFAQKDYNAAMRLLNWSIAFIDDLRLEGRSSYLDKNIAFLLALSAHVYCEAGLPEQAKNCLRKGRQIAEKFDAAPNYSSQNIRYCEKDDPHVSYDNMGHGAMDSIEQLLKDTIEKEDDPVWKMWEEVCNEK